jgi:cobalamin biosynthesis protein CobW
MRRIPVTVVTGFLGSGKTTLLCNLMREVSEQRLAIIVNEFGEVSIDGVLLRGAPQGKHVEIYDLPGGLVAYGKDDALVTTLRALHERRNVIDHVLIEASGLAVPTAIFVVLESKEFRDAFILDATLAVVDTPLLREGAFEAGQSMPGAPDVNGSVASVFLQQLEFADVIVLNKIDEIGEDDLLKAEEYLRSLAPKVRFLETAYGAKLDSRLTLGLHLHQSSRAGNHNGPVSGAQGEGAITLADQTVLDGHSHGTLDAHVHSLLTHEHFHKHDVGWQSFRLRTEDEQQADVLPDAIGTVTQEFPILRAKGFARVGSGRMTVQAVRTRVEACRDEGELNGPSELIFIGYHPRRKQVAARLTELTGTNWA